MTMADSSDRRDSFRVPIEVMIRDLALGGSFEPRTARLSLNGIYFTEGHPPIGRQVEFRFLPPGGRTEVRSRGEIVRVDQEGARFGALVAFQDLPVEDELAIARALQTTGR
jgi:hypothetical protein